MKRNWLNLLCCVSLILAGLCLASCDSDNEDFLTVSDDEEVRVDYRVLDENGNVVDEFHYGDKIVFDLIVTNITDHDLDFENDIEIWAPAFRVFTADGQYINCAYLAMTLEGRPPVKLKPGEQFHAQQIWGREPLPTGEYISPYAIKNGKTYSVKFKIII